MRRTAAVAAAALLVAAAGCDAGGDDGGSGSSSSGPTKVTTTRVQVVEGLGRGNGGFDPAAIYDRLSPGVVTILSLFGGGNNLLETAVRAGRAPAS